MNLRRRQAVIVEDPNERSILIKSLNGYLFNIN